MKTKTKTKNQLLSFLVQQANMSLNLELDCPHLSTSILNLKQTQLIKKNKSQSWKSFSHILKQNNLSVCSFYILARRKNVYIWEETKGKQNRDKPELKEEGTLSTQVVYLKWSRKLHSSTECFSQQERAVSSGSLALSSDFES